MTDVRDYDQLIDALRGRIAELGIGMEGLDYVAGLPLRYSSKLLTRLKVKGIGRQSLGPLLCALGVKISLVPDEENAAYWQKHIAPRLAKRTDASARMPARRKRNKSREQWRGNSSWGRMMRALQIQITGPDLRSQRARKAAMTRWAAKRDNGT